jgi:streptogramin lyase
MARLVTTRSIFLATCLTAGVFSAAGAAEVADIEAALAHGTLGIAGPMKKGVVPLCVPIGIALNASDELYVGDHYAASGCGPTSQITVYDSNGKPEPTKTITKGIANAAGLAFDAKGNLYVADYANVQVEVFNKQGKPQTSKTLKTDANYIPSGVQVDKSGRIWVANRTNNNISIGEIQIFNRSGAVGTTITQNLVYPIGIAFSPKTGDAWVANSETPNDAISTYNAKGKALTIYPTPGFTPTYIAFAKNGNSYVTDGLHNAVEIFDPSGAEVGSPITTNLSAPYGIAVNSKGDFYVANIGPGGVDNGSTIIKFDSTGKILCTISGTDGCK